MTSVPVLTRARWEGSVNTNIRVEEKSEVFRLLQQLLQRIGYYDGSINADPARTIEALKKYKQAKGQGRSVLGVCNSRNGHIHG